MSISVSNLFTDETNRELFPAMDISPLAIVAVSNAPAQSGELRLRTDVSATKHFQGEKVNVIIRFGGDSVCTSFCNQKGPRLTDLYSSKGMEALITIRHRLAAEPRCGHLC